MNHPAMHDPEVEARLLQAARHKPSNSDVYTVALADFVDAFARVLGPDRLPWHFMIEGGALAVEQRPQGGVRLEEPAQRGARGATPSSGPRSCTCATPSTAARATR